MEFQVAAVQQSGFELQRSERELGSPEKQRSSPKGIQMIVGGPKNIPPPGYIYFSLRFQIFIVLFFKLNEFLCVLTN